MDMVVENMPILDEAKNAVEIVVHISENLEDMQRNNLVVALEDEDGIVSAEFCPLRYHLMLVRYDTHMFSSVNLIATFKSQNVKARLMARRNWLST